MSTDHGDATTRFTNRVRDYVRFRPGYPTGVVELLRERCGLGTGSTVADIGAGTGIFTRLLLETGARVHAVEPNNAMQDALTSGSPSNERLSVARGTADATGCANGTLDIITAAQAFHWFDPTTTRTEFLRILKPGGWVALIWNSRLTDRSPFLEAYERLLVEKAVDYSKVTHRHVDRARVESFFKPAGIELHTFPNHQHFDFEGLRGRVLSSSYAPAVGQPGHESMMEELQELFGHHNDNGLVRFEYETEVYLGRLS
jgi:SAM-dependent methyltransferase